MNYYNVSINIRLVDGLQRLRVLELVVQAPNRIEACTEAIHAYRLAVPADLKKLDLEIGEVVDVTEAIEELLL